jgi:signal transduction histidine kinase
MHKNNFLMKKNVLEEVYKASTRFLTPLNLEETYKVFMEEVLRLSDGRYGSILIFKNRAIRRVYSTSPFLDSIKPRHRGYLYRAYNKKKSLILTHKQLDKVHPEITKAKIKYDVVIPLVNNNKSIGVFTVLSEKKIGKNQLKALKLFSPLAALAIRKAQLYAEVKKAIEIRDLFISLASHELRTPITTTYIYLQIIERNYAKKLPFDPKWVENLKEEMERLTTIIDELLEVDQIKSGKLSYTFEECNLENITKRAVKMVSGKYKKHTFKFIGSVNKSNHIVIGDVNKLVGLFINLLENAAKHSSPKYDITITIYYSRKYVSVIIGDHGTGIEEEDLDKIFVNFYKGKNNTKPGLGLGLYLAKEVIDKHRGKITIKSKVGKGTSVEVKLPLLK